MPFHCLPIIYVHEASSFPDELVGSMFTAHIANPDSPIYLITNLKERPKTPSETFDQALVLVDVNAHRPATEALGQVFFNISAMPGSFERMCLDRWFMLRSFVRQMGFSRFFTLDSDVLLFCDVQEEADRLRDFDYTISSRYNWCHVFFNNAAVLDVYCEMVLEVYSRRTSLWHSMCDFMNLFRPSEPLKGLGDMTLAGLLSERIAPGMNLKFVDTATVIDGMSYCSNISLPLPDVEMTAERVGGKEVNIKKIYWFEGLPHCRVARTGEYIRMNCLHFQGESKAFLGSVFEIYIRLLSQSTSGRRVSHLIDTMLMLQGAFKDNPYRRGVRSVGEASVA